MGCHLVCRQSGTAGSRHSAKSNSSSANSPTLLSARRLSNAAALRYDPASARKPSPTLAAPAAASTGVHPTSLQFIMFMEFLGWLQHGGGGGTPTQVNGKADDKCFPYQNALRLCLLSWDLSGSTSQHPKAGLFPNGKPIKACTRQCSVAPSL